LPKHDNDRPFRSNGKLVVSVVRVFETTSWVK